MKPETPLAQRFWPKVDIKGPHACWLWKASVVSTGYGTIGYRGKVISSNRAAWLLTHFEMPKYNACHKCDNPLCCNPGHLFDGTHQENMADKVAKGRWRGHDARGDTHWNTKIKEAQLAEVHDMSSRGMTQRAIAGHFHVSHSLISAILLRKRRHR